jgi:hypothetical protein
LSEKFVTLINTGSVLKMSTKAQISVHVKCSLLLCNFNQNWNVLTNVSKTL